MAASFDRQSDEEEDEDMTFTITSRLAIQIDSDEEVISEQPAPGTSTRRILKKPPFKVLPPAPSFDNVFVHAKDAYETNSFELTYHGNLFTKVLDSQDTQNEQEEAKHQSNNKQKKSMSLPKPTYPELVSSKVSITQTKLTYDPIVSSVDTRPQSCRIQAARLKHQQVGITPYRRSYLQDRITSLMNTMHKNNNKYE